MTHKESFPVEAASQEQDLLSGIPMRRDLPAGWRAGQLAALILILKIKPIGRRPREDFTSEIGPGARTAVNNAPQTEPKCGGF